MLVILRFDFRREEPEGNIYDNLIDITDLLSDEDDMLYEMREVKNLLLRYHSDLKAWYRAYASKIEESDESFSLTTKMLWKFFRDGRVLTATSSIAAINRLFLKGIKNQYTLSTNKDSLLRKLVQAKSNVRWPSLFVRGL